MHLRLILTLILTLAVTPALAGENGNPCPDHKFCGGDDGEPGGPGDGGSGNHTTTVDLELLIAAGAAAAADAEADADAKARATTGDVALENEITFKAADLSEAPGDPGTLVMDRGQAGVTGSFPGGAFSFGKSEAVATLESLALTAHRLGNQTAANGLLALAYKEHQRNNRVCRGWIREDGGFWDGFPWLARIPVVRTVFCP